MERAFSFKQPEEGAVVEPHVLIINEDRFELAPDLSGQELLSLSARAGTTDGVHRLISRVISDDDWDRWMSATKYCKLQDFGEIGTAIINLYADFPITAGAGS